MFYKVKTFITFLLKSLNQSKIKSVFISDFINLSFKQTKNQQNVFFKNYKEVLLKNEASIQITDFGAGSKIFNNNKRQISKIAKYAGISNKNALNLANIINFLQSKFILEIGTSLGIATSALSIGNSNSKITTLEGCPETAKIAQQQFDKFNLDNINLIIGDFKTTLPKAIKNNNFDFIYFDGNHQKEATLDYFNLCLQTINNNSVFIFDDIHWSKGMEEAWKEIKQHPKVTTTIDTFQWGIVFFRKELEKQHLTIRV